MRTARLKAVTSKQSKNVDTNRQRAPKWSAVERMSVKDISAAHISSSIEVVKTDTTGLKSTAAPIASQFQREHPVSG